jgi:hypothetical protein
MSVPQSRKKADIISVTRVWLQIYSIVADTLKEEIPDVQILHSVSASAANTIVKEVDINGYTTD